MEGNYNKPLISDPEFDSLIPKPNGTTETIKRHALLEDTIEFLPQAIKRITWQVKRIIPLIEADTLNKTCNNIWTRLYNGIRYCKDDKGKEQIRSPRCTWWGRKGDCDDFSVFVSAILCNLQIPHLFRIAMYKEEDGYQHIYPVAITPDGKEIVIDCVLNRFNKEVPYIKKIDKEMELQFLDGVDDKFLQNTIGNIDAQDLLKGDLGDLGRKKFKDSKFGQALKKGLHLVNRANPATTILRLGVLASMKVNLFNIAGRLRYSYLSDEQAKKLGLDMDKFPKLKSIREKLERIFYGAGGKEENLKKAILTGHGNKNKEVPLSGLGSIEGTNDEQSELPQLLGIETYNSEMQENVSLGEPATGAAIAAATSAMAAIAAIIKSLGALKKGGGDKSDTTSADNGSSTDNGSTDSNAADNSASNEHSKNAKKTPTDGGANKTDTPAAATDGSEGDGSANDGENERKKNPALIDKEKAPEKLTGFARAKDWVSKNKLAASGIGLVAVATIAALSYGGYKLATRNKEKKKEVKPVNNGQEVSGVHGKRKSRRHRKIKIQKLR